MRENKQTPVPQLHSESGVLKVHSIFPTIQGEGPFCGERALFFRLWGCNLRCPGCDTDYTSAQLDVAATYLERKAHGLGWRPGDLVVITGGEPLRQNIAPAVEHLLRAGYRVQIETNGVLWNDNLPYRHPDLTIVCSPKTSRIHDMVHAHADAFKYILRAGEVDDKDGLPTRALQHAAKPRVARPRDGAPVYVQPMDEDDAERNALNLAAAINSTMKFGHRLQIQVHKIINME